MNNLEATEEIRASHECVPFFDYKTKTIFFTICSWNSLAYAITLWKSLTKFNGPVTFYAAICDAADGFDYLSLPFPVVLIEKLGIPSLDSMADRYNITELSRAIKPFVFTYLFEKHSDSVVVYMDPDILVTSRLEELRKLLAEGADCVLTPHILEPNEFAAFNEKQMLVYGIYNLGFCALRATPKVRRIVSWWGRMLEKDCVIGPSNRLFVDQKWADLLPAFVERTSILHHCGYNVAYWNLAQRRVRQTEKGWVVDNQPLRFLHFSGNRISDSVLFSRHSQDWALNFGDTPLLFEEYVNCVKSNGHDYYRQIPYGFNLNGEAGVNLEATESEQSEPLSSCNLRGLGSQQTDGLLPPIQLLRVSSFSSFQEIKNQMSETFLERTQCEIDSIPSDESVFYLPGFCVVCGKMSSFQVSYTYSTQKLPNGHQIPNWREHLNCTHCGFVNRMRAFFHIFFQEGTPSIDDCIYITEQSTAAYRWLARFFPNLTGSEYMGSELEPGTLVAGFRHEDLQNLSFPDNSLDCILSLDVLEHVPDYKKALAEVFRCLRRGGKFMFSAPFCVDDYENTILARMTNDGHIEHLREPEYHGNPIDPEHGSLCFRYYGWELIDDLLNSGFEKSECVFYWSQQYCYLGQPQFLMMAEKPLE